jgi:hypothetical protein
MPCFYETEHDLYFRDLIEGIQYEMYLHPLYYVFYSICIGNLRTLYSEDYILNLYHKLDKNHLANIIYFSDGLYNIKCIKTDDIFSYFEITFIGNGQNLIYTNRLFYDLNYDMDKYEINLEQFSNVSIYFVKMSINKDISPYIHSSELYDYYRQNEFICIEIENIDEMAKILKKDDFSAFPKINYDEYIDTAYNRADVPY